MNRNLVINIANYNKGVPTNTPRMDEIVRWLARPHPVFRMPDYHEANDFARVAAYLERENPDNDFARLDDFLDKFLVGATVTQVNWTTPEGLTLAGLAAKNALSMVVVELINRGLIPTDGDLKAAEEILMQNHTHATAQIAPLMRKQIKFAEKITAMDEIKLYDFAVKNAQHIKSVFSSALIDLRPRKTISAATHDAGEFLARLAGKFALAMERAVNEPPQRNIQTEIKKYYAMRDVMKTRAGVFLQQETKPEPADI